MDIEIREIEEKDYPTVLSLFNDELGITWVNAENITSHYNRVKDDENYKTFVALSENKTIGFISTVKAFSIVCKTGYMHIQNFAIQRKFQNKGIGTKLLKHTEDYAREKGIHSIILTSTVKRTDAHAFYEHNGYDKDSWCFDKML